MNPTFLSHVEKLAVSAGAALRVMNARAAQGVRINPMMMQHAQAAAAQGLRSTPAAVRRTALHAAEAGGAQARMQAAAANPVVQGGRSRILAGYDRAVAGAPGVYDPKRALPAHYDHGAIGQAMDRGVLRRPTGYSQQHINAMAGGGALHDPQGILTPARPAAPAVAPTVISGTRQKPPSGLSATVRAKTPRPAMGAVG